PRPRPGTCVLRRGGATGKRSATSVSSAAFGSGGEEEALDPMVVALIAFPLLALGVGVLLGRRSSAAAERARTLEAEVGAGRSALERALGEKRGVEEELVAARAEAAGYRERVVQHFYGTSEQLRALTLRYRELFEHLADGARQLSPEASNALQAGLPEPAESAAPVAEATAPEQPTTAESQPADAPVRPESF